VAKNNLLEKGWTKTQPMVEKFEPKPNLLEKGSNEVD